MSITPTGRGQLVKMLTTLEPHGIFFQTLLTVVPTKSDSDVIFCLKLLSKN